MIRSHIATSRTEVISERGVVSCGHMAEAEAGARIIEEGGNAVDAVVAAAFTGFVVEPVSCGLGGYGHMALFLADTRELVSVDHYVRAPAAARPEMFAVDESAPTTYYGWPRTVDRQNEWGAMSIAVPGAVAGLCAAHARWGRLPLVHVLEPAIEAAEAGVGITWDLILAIVGRLEEIEATPNAAAVLLRDGRPPRLPEDGAAPGGALERIDMAPLAETLRKIARHGAAGFYDGRIAELIEQAAMVGGGILTASDLASYRPIITVEPGAWYRGLRYCTARDPIGYEALGILGCFDLATYGPESSEYRHLMAEAMGHAFVDNMHHFTDPDFGPSPVSGLSSAEFAASRAAGIRLDRAAPRPIEPGDPWQYARGSECRRGRRDAAVNPGILGYQPDGCRRCRRQHRGADHVAHVRLRLARLRPRMRLLPQQRDAQFRPATRPPQLHRSGQDADLRRAGDRRRTRRRRCLRCRWFRRVPDHERRASRARQPCRLRHGCAASRRQSTCPLPGSGDVRRQPHPACGSGATA